jgi:signal peptidase I
MSRDPNDHDPYPRDPHDRVDPYGQPDRTSAGYVAEEGGSGRHGHEVDPDRGEERSSVAPVRRKRKDMPLWQELPLLLIVAFCLAVLVRTFLVQAFYIPSGSMEPRLMVGDRVLTNKIVYDVRQPTRGEIVVFRGTDNWAPEARVNTNASFFGKLGHTVGDLVGFGQPSEKDFIKRVIGLPGDTVACCDVNGRVTVNGFPLDEPYVIDNSPLDVPPNPKECHSRRFGPINVEQGQMFVMGDHRANSQDSRCSGQVPIANVIGRAFVIVWPGNHWSGLGVPPTFGNVPRPLAAAPGRPAVRPAPPVVATGALLTMPILASSAFTARSRRSRRGRGRRLLA